MSRIDAIVERMRQNPSGLSFGDVQKVCHHYFGPPRISKGSHCIYRTPWPGDPRVNIQSRQGKAKPYQVRQVLQAIEKLEASHGP